MCIHYDKYSVIVIFSKKLTKCVSSTTAIVPLSSLVPLWKWCYEDGLPQYPAFFKSKRYFLTFDRFVSLLVS